MKDALIIEIASWVLAVSLFWILYQYLCVRQSREDIGKT